MTGAAEFPVHDRLPDRQLTGVGTGGFVRRGPWSLVGGWVRAWGCGRGTRPFRCTHRTSPEAGLEPAAFARRRRGDGRLPRGICGHAAEASWHPAYALELRAAATCAG